MDKLADALADALRAGVPAAEGIGRAYFNFRVWDDVISYGAPCITTLVLAVLVVTTIRWAIRFTTEANAKARSDGRTQSGKAAW